MSARPRKRNRPRRSPRLRRRGLQIESLEARHLLSVWTNVRNVSDVNNDGLVTPVDPLIVINRLNSSAIPTFPVRPGLPPPFLDPSGDGILAPVDALIPINTINADQGPPDFVSIALKRDTAPAGTTNNDRLTFAPTIVGQVNDLTGISSLQARLDGGSIISLDVSLDGRFEFSPPLSADGSDDGPHLVSFRARDARNHQTEFVDFHFTLDTTAPPSTLTIQLDELSDTLPLGDGKTRRELITLRGETQPGAEIALLDSGLRTVADDSGAFTLHGVPLPL